MKNEIDCPVDLVSVNENKVRLVALLVLTLGLVYLWNGWWGIIVLLVADFLLRSFKLNKYSVLALAADGLVKLFGVSAKPTDQAPKRFAARMGLAFTIVILSLHFLQHTSAVVLTVALCLFAFLESFLGVCVGCYVYSYARRFGLL
ncbi:uncharacterized protein DUF4395 [Mucilaginibacter gracilis]|uniref:Uncharacterized protein DUF4395 n=1 Tax=Mucilaginibacter gracilis TaxID=423350 RepID=A0A495J7M1_9SPHI|nr:DUF4395 domain-containing protein [Mucilaginibacter gracilis]RKR84985.1 uncharacterized protein DUF4395 [Mucilaginibacter gracilis]